MKTLFYITTVLSILMSSATLAFADDLTLTYEYKTPYTGAGNIIVYNNGNTPVGISQLKFSINATLSGNPYGTLWGYQSTLKATPNPDGVHTDYYIQENPLVTIAPHQSATLSYTANALGGPFTPNNILMGPDKLIALITPPQPHAVGTETNIPIKDACSGSACINPGNGKRIMGYYPDWAYWRAPKFLANQIPFTKVNAINYAFSIFDQDGKISLYDKDSDAINMPIIAEARQQYPYLNASLSFGGWSWASTPQGWQCQKGDSPAGPAACFSKLAADPEATAKFILNAVNGMKEMGFNGIDIDWEYPAAKDATNYVNLLQGLRVALDKQSTIDKTQYYLTIATPAGIDKIVNLTNPQWQTIFQTVDYVDVMTYDFHGSWDAKSDFMSAMNLDPIDPTIQDQTLGKYNVTDAIKAYQDRGLTTNKIVLGVPMYGRMSNIKSAGTTEGLYQDITGIPVGEWDNEQSGHTGMIDYKCIVDRTSCGNAFVLPTLTLANPATDPLGQYAQTPWGYAADKFITFDDANAASLKAQWVLKNNFAGVMLWDFSGDFETKNPLSIVAAIQKIFGASK